MEPLEIVKEWLEEYKQTGPLEYDAAVLSTSTADNKPSNRVILIREISSEGLIFYTNLGSNKAKAITENNNIALNFYFRELKKQIRIEGLASLITDDKADSYFATRSRDKQISSWASKQSTILSSEEVFANQIKYFEEKFKNSPIPRPPFWSGYITSPSLIEFWQDGHGRRHHRLCYQKIANKWRQYLLYP